MDASTSSKEDNSGLVRNLDFEGHSTCSLSPVNINLLSKKSSKHRGFKLAALNIACIPGNIEELRVYMNMKRIDILAINETSLDNTISSGEVLKRNHRNMEGGGTALCIWDTVNYKRLYDFEWTGIKVIKPKVKPFIVSN